MRLHPRDADIGIPRNIYNSTPDQGLPWVAETRHKILVARAATYTHIENVLKAFDHWPLLGFIEEYGLRPIWYDYWSRFGPRLFEVPYKDAFQLLDRTGHLAIRPHISQLAKALNKLPHGKTGTMGWISEVTQIPKATLYKIRQGRDTKLQMGRFVALAVVLNFPIQILEKTGDPADLL